MFALKHVREIQLAGDVYAVRPRGHQGEILCNFEYAEVRAVSCPAGVETARITLPADEFLIYQWLVAPHGNTSYLFSADDVDFGIRIDHAAGVASRFAVPREFGVPSGLAWWDPRFAVLSSTDVVWVAEPSGLIKASPQEADVLYSRPFRRITKRFGVIKTEPNGRGLYVSSREYEATKIGFVPIAEEDAAPLLMHHDGSAVDVTSYRDALFVTFEKELVQHRRGRTEVAFVPTESELVMSANVIESVESAYLIVLIGCEDKRESRLVFFEITAPEAGV